MPDTKVVPDYDRLGYALAARVFQSDLYRQLDDLERAQCDELFLLAAAPPPAPADVLDWVEGAISDIDHAALLCHAHEDFGKGRERGLLDAIEILRARLTAPAVGAQNAAQQDEKASIKLASDENGEIDRASPAVAAPVSAGGK